MFTTSSIGSTQALCLAIFTVSSAVRLYVKFVLRGDQILLEDYAFFAAWAMTALIIIGVLMLTHYGEGHHVWDLCKAQYQEFLNWLYICTVVYGPAAFARKATLLLLIARVFSVKDRVSRALRWFMTGLAVVYSGTLILKVMVCTPISVYWEIKANVGVNGRNPCCLKQSYMFLADISVAILADFHHPHRHSFFGFVYTFAFFEVQDAIYVAAQRLRSCGGYFPRPRS